MKILSIEKATNTVHTRTVAIEDGPRLPAGPLYQDDIEFVADTVEIKWEEGKSLSHVLVTGYRLRDGFVNKSYRHQKLYKNYSHFPAWLTKIVTDTAVVDTK